jgi:acyl-CoA dehydrogenase
MPHTWKDGCHAKGKALDFTPSPVSVEYATRLTEFMDDHVYPAESVFREQVDADRWSTPLVIDQLKTEARRRGLWNLFLPGRRGAGLSNLEYAPLAEIMGRSPEIAPVATNCAAPDTGNMEILATHGTSDQQARWLEPLLGGEIRSCFGMTEPAVASSDARNIETAIVRDGDSYVITGEKWWTSGAMHPDCSLMIVMGVTDPTAPAYRRQSQVLVPMDAPGVAVVRPLTVMGYDDAPHGHASVSLDQVRVPVTNRLGGEGDGFAIAQERLGPGRIHHCMRLLGMAERAFDLMCERALARTAFGGPLADKGVVQQWIADSRIELEQARLLVLKAAWLMDTVGNKGARVEIAAIKVVVPNVALQVIDRAMQTFGGAGVSGDTPLAAMWAQARSLRIADGPDEVHRRSVARRELRRYGSTT